MAPKRARASAAADSDSEGTDYSDAAPAVKKGLKKRVSNVKGGDKSKAKGKKGKGRAATDDEEEEEEEEEEEGGEPKKGKKGKAGALGDEVSWMSTRLVERADESGIGTRGTHSEYCETCVVL
jgi:hypothetical protein